MASPEAASEQTAKTLESYEPHRAALSGRASFFPALLFPLGALAQGLCPSLADRFDSPRF